MKIEKINDNQIRCILTKGDLLQRHLSLKALASGSEGAQALFREMLAQSYEETGFEPNEYPLMIEAAPAGDGNLALTITKVNSPDELPLAAQANHLLRALQHIVNLAKEQEQGKLPEPKPVAVFAFDARRQLLLPPGLRGDPAGVRSALYLASKAGLYYLVVTASPRKKDSFTSLCHLLSEYGRGIPVTPGTKAYFTEHYECIFPKNAIQHIADGELQ